MKHFRACLKHSLFILLALLLHGCSGEGDCFIDVVDPKSGSMSAQSNNVKLIQLDPSKENWVQAVDLKDALSVKIEVTGVVSLCHNQNVSKASMSADAEGKIIGSAGVQERYISARNTSLNGKSGRWVSIDENVYKDDIITLTVPPPNLNPGYYYGVRDTKSGSANNVNDKGDSAKQAAVGAWSYVDELKKEEHCELFKSCEINDCGDTVLLSHDTPRAPGKTDESKCIFLPTLQTGPNASQKSYICPMLDKLKPSNTDDGAPYARGAQGASNNVPVYDCWYTAGAGLQLQLLETKSHGTCEESCQPGSTQSNTKWFVDPEANTTTQKAFGDLLYLPGENSEFEYCKRVMKKIPKTPLPDGCKGPVLGEGCWTLPSGCKDGDLDNQHMGCWEPKYPNDLDKCPDRYTTRLITAAKQYACICARIADSDASDNLGGYKLQVMRQSCIAKGGNPSAAYEGQTDKKDYGRVEYKISDGTPKASDTSDGNINDEGNNMFSVPVSSASSGTLYLRINNDIRKCKNPQGENFCSGSYDVKIMVIKSAGGGVGPISTVIEYLAQFIKNEVLANLKTIFDNIARDTDYMSFIRALLVLYIVVYGTLSLMGYTQLTQKELLVRAIKIGVVVTLLSATSWQFFKCNFFDLFLNGMDDLIVKATLQDPTSGGEIVIDSVCGTKYIKPANTFKFVDKMFGLIFAPTMMLKILAFTVMSPLGLIMAIMIVVALFLFLLGTLDAVLTYLMAIFIVGLLISLGPIFIPCILFEKTKPLFDKWIEKLIQYSIEPVMLVIGLKLIMDLIYITLTQAIDFTVCWKCAWAFMLPEPFSGLTTFFFGKNPGPEASLCIPFFSPFGVAPTSALMFSMNRLVFVLFFLILASLLHEYSKLIKDMTAKLVGFKQEFKYGRGAITQKEAKDLKEGKKQAKDLEKTGSILQAGFTSRISLSGSTLKNFLGGDKAPAFMQNFVRGLKDDDSVSLSSLSNMAREYVTETPKESIKSKIAQALGIREEMSTLKGVSPGERAEETKKIIKGVMEGRATAMSGAAYGMTGEEYRKSMEVLGNLRLLNNDPKDDQIKALADKVYKKQSYDASLNDLRVDREKAEKDARDLRDNILNLGRELRRNSDLQKELQALAEGKTDKLSKLAENKDFQEIATKLDALKAVAYEARPMVNKATADAITKSMSDATDSIEYKKTFEALDKFSKLDKAKVADMPDTYKQLHEHLQSDPKVQGEIAKLSQGDISDVSEKSRIASSEELRRVVTDIRAAKAVEGVIRPKI